MALFGGATASPKAIPGEAHLAGVGISFWEKLAVSVWGSFSNGAFGCGGEGRWRRELRERRGGTAARRAPRAARRGDGGRRGWERRPARMGVAVAGRAPRAGGGAAAGAHEAKRAAATGAEGMGGRRRPARRGGWGRRRPSGREGVAAELRAVGPRGGEELHAAGVEGRGGGRRGGEELRRPV